MHTLREWRTEAEKRGYTRIAELADYLQADERTHVRLGTDWIGRLTNDNLDYREELVRWGREAIGKMDEFWSDGDGSRHDAEEARFTFYKPTQMKAHHIEGSVAGE
jgi:rubrerythrin